MLSQVIAHSCNIGYEMNKNLHLKSFNNIKIKNLKHLKSLIDEFENKQKNKNVTKKTKVVKSPKNSKINIENVHALDSNSNIGSDRVETAMVFEFANGQIIVLDGDEAIQAKDQVDCSYILLILSTYQFLLLLTLFCLPLYFPSRLFSSMVIFRHLHLFSTSILNSCHSIQLFLLQLYFKLSNLPGYFLRYF